jgi:hypothetical protein
MSIGMTPFRALYIYDPLSFVEIFFGDNRAPMVQDWIQQSQDILKELKDQLKRAHNQQKVQADKHRVEHTFEVGLLEAPTVQTCIHQEKWRIKAPTPILWTLQGQQQGRGRGI